jgi:mycofactocin glycosyltransferase
MASTMKMAENNAILSYILSKGVSIFEKGSTLYLIRKNPLTTITLNPVWAPALNLLSQGEFIPFNEVCAYVDADPDKTEIFLNSLVRKGFLESRGYRALSDYPSVTVIIPVRNRPEDISECLTSLIKLDYPEEIIEIIVVDDASDDNTPQVISGFPVKLIKNPVRSQASFSRNLAAKEARGDIIAFIDSDCVAHPLWLKELVPAFMDETNGAVGGKVDSWFKKKAIDQYEKVSSSLNMGNRSRSSKEDGNFFYLPTCNLLVKKKLFLKLGGFNIDMTVGEDVDFCWRLKDSGYEIEYQPAGVVFHKHRNKISAFFSRRFEYGTSEPLLQKKHPDRIKRMFYLPLTVLFWLTVLTATTSGHISIFFLCGFILLIDTHVKWMQGEKKSLPIKYMQILCAVFRGYFVSLYYWCAFFSRYYLFIALMVVLFSPVTTFILIISHLLVTVCEIFIKKFNSGFLSFAFYFTLDQLAYQLGVWYGCFRNNSFNPVNPVISRWKS